MSAEGKSTSVFDQSSDALLVLRKSDGSILNANQAFCRMFGYASPSNAIEQHISFLFSSDVRQTSPTLAADICSRRSSWDKLLFLTAEKDICAVSVTSSFIPWKNGQAVLVTLKASEEFRKTREKLRQECSQHIEKECPLLKQCVEQKTRELAQINEDLTRAVKAKDTFLAIMSHELRTPMNSVCGFADSLLLTPLKGKQQIYAQSINSSARKLLRVINDILDFSKIEAGRMELECVPFDWTAIVREAFQIFKPQTNRKNIRTQIDIKNNFPSQLKGDPHRVQQILMNLLANAVKFTEKGEIRFEASYQNLESNRPAQRIEAHFIVSDTGIGIPPERMNALFQPFQQADLSTTRKFGGTGLGLAICKRLCELMGGRIWVEHEQSGWGAVFHVVLPFEVARDEDEPMPPYLEEQDGTWKQKALSETTTRRFFDWRALVVENDALGQEVARELLQDLGCEVVLVTSAKEALEKLSHEKIDLILINMELLDVEGEEKIIQKRRSCRMDKENEPPFIFGMIPPTSDMSREFCLSLGMDDCLTQPLDAKQLSCAVEQLTAQVA